MNWTERLAKIWNRGNAKLQTRNWKLSFAVFGLLDAKGLYSQLSAILDFRKLDGVLASNNTLQSNFVLGLVALQKLVFILHNKNVDSEKYSRMAKIHGHEIATEFVSRNFKKSSFSSWVVADAHAQCRDIAS